MSKTDAAEVAAEAFAFGYPLVLSDRTRRWMTEASAPDPARMKAPPNTFVHARDLPGATSATLSGAHADTLRSSAWVDLADGPVVLTVPDTHGRFYALSMVDLWTEVFATVGARTTGTGSGTYAISGPRSTGGTLAPGMLPLSAPTRHVRIAGLTQVDGPDRLAEAHALQDGLRLERLVEPAGAGGNGAAVVPRGRADRTPPVGQLDRMDARTFFSELSGLLRENPPRLEDRRVVDRMRRLGILVEERDGWDRLGADLQAAVERGARRGLERVMAMAESPPGDRVGEWRIRFRLGHKSRDYLSRAAAACVGLETSSSADELPALVRTDADGRPLTGRRHYLLRFPPGAAPPVHGFWTLTTYDDRQALVDNPVDCYSVGGGTGLALDTDGSLVIRIQHRPPPEDGAAHWLPAPPGPFNLLLRLIWPQGEVLDRGWRPPPVEALG
jgi:hypothetical protein